MSKTTVIIIRHGEKHEWTAGKEPTAAQLGDYTDTHKLSAKGTERAHALTGYFTARREMTDLFGARPLAGLIAQDKDNITNYGKSERPKQTLAPFFNHVSFTESGKWGGECGVTFDCFSKTNVGDVAAHVNSPQFFGKSVIICWSHQQIPHLCALIGANCPSRWPKRRYDVTWVLEIDNLANGAGGCATNFKALPQCLLYGDANHTD